MANKKSSKEDIEKKEDVAQTFVYIGPTIPQLSILKHKLFKNGLSPECEKLNITYSWCKVFVCGNQ